MLEEQLISIAAFVVYVREHVVSVDENKDG